MRTVAPREPEVAILLASRNGARFLPDQLASIAAQRWANWRLIVSDDGSTDRTLEIADAFALAHPSHEVDLRIGPGRGPAQNFLSLLCRAGRSVPYAALSDQDDVWLPGKLARAVSWLSVLSADLPAVYCGRTRICDAEGRAVGLSPMFGLLPSFRNALVQSIAGGNTMVLNRAALDLLQAASKEAGEIVMHDWWIYQVVTGAGGAVLYDAEPMVLYRQHGSNAVGANRSAAARVRRAQMVARGILKDWNAVNLAALSRSAHRLTPENRAILQAFSEATRSGCLSRLRQLSCLGLYRQTAAGRASYWCAAAAGLI